MQQAAFSELRGRRVITKSGQMIGRLKDVVIDADTARVINIIVSRTRFGVEIAAISYSDIIEIRADAIIVRDAFVTNRAVAAAEI